MTRRARVAPAIALAMRVVCDKEGNADGGKSNDNDGDGQATVTGDGDGKSNNRK
jgi:hypothetical protein